MCMAHMPWGLKLLYMAEDLKVGKDRTAMMA